MTNFCQAPKKVSHAIKRVLEKFQDGYTKRNVNEVDTFLDELFLLESDLLLIGTGAIDLNGYEFSKGPKGARNLVEEDWKYWGDMILDIDDALVSSVGDVAWVATTGIVEDIICPEAYFNYRIEQINKILQSDLSPELKSKEIVKDAAETILETARGDNYSWPFRFSAVLVKVDGKWLFHQIHFAYPRKGYPSERNVTWK